MSKLNDTSENIKRTSSETSVKKMSHMNSSVVQEIYDHSNHEPKLLVTITNKEIYIDEIVVLICEFSCLSDDYTVDWFHQNQPLYTREKCNIQTTRTGVNHYRTVLTMIKAEKKDEGTYTCQIKNIHGTTSSTARLLIKGKKIETLDRINFLTWNLSGLKNKNRSPFSINRIDFWRLI
jgi:hypothetical protein